MLGAECTDWALSAQGALHLPHCLAKDVKAQQVAPERRRVSDVVLVRARSLTLVLSALSSTSPCDMMWRRRGLGGPAGERTPWDGESADKNNTAKTMNVMAKDTEFLGHLLGQGLVTKTDIERVDRLREETGISLYSALRKSSTV